MNDPWRQHLAKYGLLELHHVAQQVGYRIRVANGWTFDLEYEGGLAKYQQRGNSLKTFEDTEPGRAEARAFLATVKADIKPDREKVFYKTTQPGYYGDVAGADALVLSRTHHRVRIEVYNLRSGEVECKTVSEGNLRERLDDSAIDEVLQQALIALTASK